MNGDFAIARCPFACLWYENGYFYSDLVEGPPIRLRAFGLDDVLGFAVDSERQTAACYHSGRFVGVVDLAPAFAQPRPLHICASFGGNDVAVVLRRPSFSYEFHPATSAMLSARPAVVSAARRLYAERQARSAELKSTRTVVFLSF